MPRIEVEVTGESNIDLALRTLGVKTEKRILAKAFRVGAKVICGKPRSIWQGYAGRDVIQGKSRGGFLCELYGEEKTG